MGHSESMGQGYISSWLEFLESSKGARFAQYKVTRNQMPPCNIDVVIVLLDYFTHIDILRRSQLWDAAY